MRANISVLTHGGHHLGDVPGAELLCSTSSSFANAHQIQEQRKVTFAEMQQCNHKTLLQKLDSDETHRREWKWRRIGTPKSSSDSSIHILLTKLNIKGRRLFPPSYRTILNKHPNYGTNIPQTRSPFPPLNKNPLNAFQPNTRT